MSALIRNLLIFSVLGQSRKGNKKKKKKEVLTSHLSSFPQRGSALSGDSEKIFYRGLLIHFSHLPELAIITALYIEPHGNSEGCTHALTLMTLGSAREPCVLRHAHICNCKN